MKVLHLPVNIASQISVTVRALRDIGVEARGVVRGNAAICDGTALELHLGFSRRKHPVRGSLATMRWWAAVLRAIRWADVVLKDVCAFETVAGNPARPLRVTSAT